MAHVPADTLVCDTMQIAAWRQDGAYDYDRELVSQDSLGQWLLARLNELLMQILDSRAAELLTRPVLIAIGVAVVAVILWFVYKNRPELFSFRRKTAAGGEVQEETIYGIDFDREIRGATARGNWQEAVRYVYLKTLRYLSDHQRINWQLYKTPTEYVYEESHPAFRQLTTHFLRVRYGNFEATEALYDEVRRLSATLCREGKGGGEA